LGSEALGAYAFWLVWTAGLLGIFWLVLTKVFS
jgi:hypothetical protein